MGPGWPVPPSSAAAARGRSGADPASSGAGRAAGGAATPHPGAGRQRPDRFRIGRRGRVAQCGAALGRRHPVCQRHGPEQPSGARRPARPAGRRPFGPDSVRARRSAAGRRAGYGPGGASDAERAERRHSRLRAGCGAHDGAHLHRRSGGDGHGDGVQPAPPDPRPAVRGVSVDAAGQWPRRDADVLGRLSHQSGAGCGAGSGHGRRRAVLDRGLHPSPHRRCLGRRDDPASGRGAGAGAGQSRRQQRGGGRLRRQSVAHPGAGRGAGERLGARDRRRAATGDGRSRRAGAGDDHPGRKLQRAGAARGRPGPVAGARSDRRSGRPGAGQSGRQCRLSGARGRRAASAGSATDRGAACGCGGDLVPTPAHRPRRGEPDDQRHGAGRPDHDGRGRQRADRLDHGDRHWPARHDRPFPRRERSGHLRPCGYAAHPDRCDPPTGRAPPAGADRGHRRRTERQGRARSGRAVADGGRKRRRPDQLFRPCGAAGPHCGRGGGGPARQGRSPARTAAEPGSEQPAGRQRLCRRGGRQVGRRPVRLHHQCGQDGRGLQPVADPVDHDAGQRRGDLPGRAGGADHDRPGHSGRQLQPLHHDRAQGHRRAADDAPAGADAGGRGAARGAEPEPARGAAAGVAHQGHGAPRHRREAQAPGRAHSPDAGRQVAGRARLDSTVAGGRAGGAADSGQGSGRADAGPAGYGPGGAGGLPSRAGRAERHHPRHRPDRFGQDDQPLCRTVAAERRLAQHPDGRRPGGQGRAAVAQGAGADDAAVGDADLRLSAGGGAAQSDASGGPAQRPPRAGRGPRRGDRGAAPVGRHGPTGCGLSTAVSRHDGGGRAVGGAAAHSRTAGRRAGTGRGRARQGADGAGLSVRAGGGGAGRHRRHDDLYRAQGGRSVRQHGPDPAAADAPGHRPVGPDARLGLADGADPRRRGRRGVDRATARGGAAEAGRLGAAAAAGRTVDARSARGAHGPHPVDHDRGGPAGAGGADHHRPHRLHPCRIDGRHRHHRPVGDGGGDQCPAQSGQGHGRQGAGRHLGAGAGGGDLSPRQPDLPHGPAGAEGPDRAARRSGAAGTLSPGRLSAVERPRLRPAAGRRRGAGGDQRRPGLFQPEQSGAGAGRGSDREARRGGAVHRARRDAGRAARADGDGGGGPDRLDGRRRRGLAAGGGGRRLRQPPDALSHRRSHAGRGQRTARRVGGGRRTLSSLEAASVRPARGEAVAPEREHAGAAGRRAAGRHQPGRGGAERGQGGYRRAPGGGVDQPRRLLGSTRPVRRGRRRRGQGPDHPGHPLFRPEGGYRAWRRARRPHRPDPRRARRRRCPVDWWSGDAAGRDRPEPGILLRRRASGCGRPSSTPGATGCRRRPSPPDPGP
uniref:LigA n=1 Tax=Parastrongyloides trichosuri TaxID=131310 RepID=A0A0N5A4J8_PARTI